METRTFIIYYTEIRDQTSQMMLLLALALSLAALGILLDLACATVVGQIALTPVTMGLGILLATFMQEVQR